VLVRALIAGWAAAVLAALIVIAFAVTTDAAATTVGLVIGVAWVVGFVLGGLRSPGRG
jgi:hypothetical protein